MEPRTELIILGAAIGYSAKILQKLLGPTADYLAGEIKNYTEERLNTIRIIFKAAIKKLGSDIETPGQVPPRILKKYGMKAILVKMNLHQNILVVFLPHLELGYPVMIVLFHIYIQ